MKFKKVNNDLMDENGTIYKYHHTSRSQGYVSRKKNEQACIDDFNHYEGLFGKGVTVLSPAYDSTRYCYITYYITEDN